MPDAHGLVIPVRDDAREFGGSSRAAMVLGALDEIGVAIHGQRVVDLGAGFGSLAIACARRGAERVTAVDVNRARLDAIVERARAAGAEVGVREENLLDGATAPASANLAFLIGVVEYAGLWDARRSVASLQVDVLRSAHATLAPGGTLVFATKNRRWPRYLLRDVHTAQPLVNNLPRRWADRLSRRRFGTAYRHHIHSPAGWERLVREAGFDHVERYVPYLGYQFPLKLVRRPRPSDLMRLHPDRLSGEARSVAWGRAGAAKALLVGLAGWFGAEMASATVIVARR